MTSKRFVRVLALVGVLCLCDLASASRIAYSVTNLGLVWGESASANRINRTGDVVGFLWTASEGPHGFLWNRVNGMRDLGTFGGKESTAFGLNDLGDVAGQWVAADGKQYAFLWNATDGMRSLGTIGGTGERSHAWAVNDSRQVVGWCILQGWQAYDPYVWDAAHGMQDLGNMGYNACAATGINESGVVCGYLGDGGPSGPATVMRAFRWSSSSGMSQLETLGGAFSAASDINDLGDIVGCSTTPSGEKHSVIWLADGTMRDIGITGLFLVGRAHGVNRSRVVVSSDQISASAYRAFIWDEAHGKRDLNTLIDPASGWILDGAATINDAGCIAGEGHLNSAARAFLLTPLNRVSCNVSPGFIQAGITITLTAPDGTNHQWRKDGYDLNPDPQDRIAGVNSQDLVFTPVDDTDNGVYTCVYDNGAKAVIETESFQLDVLPAGSLPAASASAIGILVLIFIGAGCVKIRARVKEPCTW